MTLLLWGSLVAAAVVVLVTGHASDVVWHVAVRPDLLVVAGTASVALALLWARSSSAGATRCRPAR